MRIIIQILLVSLFLLPVVGAAQSSDVVRAKHMISQVERGLSRIKRNDTNTINGYTDKLKQAKEILEAETNKQDPGLREVAGQWIATRDKLYATLENWKSQNNAQANAPQSVAPQAAVKPSVNTPSGSKASAANPSVTAQFEQLKTKYMNKNRPALAYDADVPTAQAWLNQMLNLYGAQWQQDNQQVQQWLANGQLTQKQQNNFQHWVNNVWHNDIGEKINQAYLGWDQTININVTASQQLLTISPDNKNKVMNIAGNQLTQNQKMIADSQGLITLVSHVEKTLGKEQINLRKKQQVLLSQTSQHLNELAPFAKQYLAAWEKAPKKSNKNPNSMYLWLNGNRFAEITQKREIWINSNFAGSISKSGEIYQRGNYIGKLKPNGELWISKQNRSATLEENGEVWVSGNHVGTIHKDGNVTGIGRSASIEGPGDWRYAAVVYFLQVFPHQ